MKILWNLSCQYNNYIYIYIRKKNTNGRLKKEKKKTVATVATGPLGTVATVQKFKKKKKKSAHRNGTVDEQCKNTKWTVLKH